MKYLVSFLLLFCGLSAFSQADTIFVLGAEFGATTEPTDSTFTVDIIHPTDQLGQAFTASKIQVGYRLIDVFGRLYRVKSVDATGIGSSTLTVVELQDAAGPSGTGLVYRKPDNSDCIPEIQTGDIGISYALAARIANHNAVVGCGDTGGGGSGTVETIVAGTGISVDATDAANPIVTNTAPGSTEVADGATILGAGTGGDPFRANSALINKQIGDYAAKADSSMLSINHTLSIIGGTGAMVIRTGIRANNPVNYLKVRFALDNFTNGGANRFSTNLELIVLYIPGNADSIRQAALTINGETLITKAATVGFINNELYLTLGDITDSQLLDISLLDVIEMRDSPITFDISDANLSRTTNFAGDGYGSFETCFVRNVGVIVGMTTITNTLGHSSINHFNGVSSSNTSSIYEYFTAAGTSLQREDKLNTAGVRVGAENRPYVGSNSSFQYTVGTPNSNNSPALTRLRITGGTIGKFLFNEDTAREPALTYEFVGADGMLLPKGTTAQRGVGASGTLRWNTTTGAWDGHNGTSFGRMYLSSDVTPTNGQVKVFNSALGMDVYTTVTAAQTPAPSSTADAIGSAGDIRYDDDYIYVKTSAGWKRSALSTF